MKVEKVMKVEEVVKVEEEDFDIDLGCRSPYRRRGSSYPAD